MLLQWLRSVISQLLKRQILLGLLRNHLKCWRLIFGHGAIPQLSCATCFSPYVYSKCMLFVHALRLKHAIWDHSISLSFLASQFFSDDHRPCLPRPHQRKALKKARSRLIRTSTRRRIKLSLERLTSGTWAYVHCP